MLIIKKIFISLIIYSALLFVKNNALLALAPPSEISSLAQASSPPTQMYIIGRLQQLFEELGLRHFEELFLQINDALANFPTDRLSPNDFKQLKAYVTKVSPSKEFEDISLSEFSALLNELKKSHFSPFEALQYHLEKIFHKDKEDKNKMAKFETFIADDFDDLKSFLKRRLKPKDVAQISANNFANFTKLPPTQLKAFKEYLAYKLTKTEFQELCDNDFQVIKKLTELPLRQSKATLLERLEQVIAHLQKSLPEEIFAQMTFNDLKTIIVRLQYKFQIIISYIQFIENWGNSLRYMGLDIPQGIGVLASITAIQEQHEGDPLSARQFNILLNEVLFIFLSLHNQLISANTDHIKTILTHGNTWVQLLALIHLIYKSNHFDMDRIKNILDICLNYIFTSKDKEAYPSSSYSLEDLEKNPNTIAKDDSLTMALFKIGTYQHTGAGLMGAEEAKSLDELKKAHIKEHQKMQDLVSEHLEYRLVALFHKKSYPSVYSQDFLEQQNWYLKKFTEKITQYHQYLLSGGRQSPQVLEILQNYLAPLLQDQINIAHALDAIPYHPFYLTLIDAIQKYNTLFIINSLQYKKNFNLQNEQLFHTLPSFLILRDLYIRIRASNDVLLLENFIQNILTILELVKSYPENDVTLLITNKTLEILWTFLLIKNNRPETPLLAKITSALHKKDILSQSKKTLAFIDTQSKSEYEFLRFKIFQFVQDPQYTIKQKALEESFCYLVRKLNAFWQDTYYQESLRPLYQQLIIFTQHDASWRKIFEKETEPDILLWIQEQCRQAPVISSKSEKITIATLTRAIQDEDVEALAIIDNPAHALEIVKLIQELVHKEEPQIATIDYKALYQRLVTFLSQEMSTLKQLLASIEPRIPSHTSITSFKKRTPMAYSGWDNMVAWTLNIIASKMPSTSRHLPSKRRSSCIKWIFYISWLNKNKHYFIVYNEYIRNIFENLNFIPISYFSSSPLSTFYRTFKKWWDTIPDVEYDKVFNMEDLENIGSQIEQDNISLEEMQVLCDLWMSKIYQLELFLATIYNQSPKFRSLKEGFMQLCQNKTNQWKHLKSLDSLEKLFPQIFALGALGRKRIFLSSKKYFGIWNHCDATDKYSYPY